MGNGEPGGGDGSTRRLRARDIVAAAAGVLSFSLVQNLGTAFDVWEKAQLAFGWKPDQMEIAEAGERERFTREFLQLAHRRVLEIRNFVDLAVARRPEPELNEAWKSYLAARMAWSERALVTAMAIERWYGVDRRRILEGQIEPVFGQMHWCMLDLRFNGSRALSESSSECRGNLSAQETTPNALHLRTLSNVATRKLYCLASGIRAVTPATAGPPVSCDQV